MSHLFLSETCNVVAALPSVKNYAGKGFQPFMTLNWIELAEEINESLVFQCIPSTN